MGLGNDREYALMTITHHMSEYIMLKGFTCKKAHTHGDNDLPIAALVYYLNHKKSSRLEIF